MRKPFLMLALAAACLTTPAVAAAESDYVVPRPSRHTLENGLEILVLEAHELPTVHYRLLLRSGSTEEAPAKAGLASLTARALLQPGSGDAEALAYTDRLTDLGAEITASSAYDYSLARGQSLSRHWGEVLSLMAGRITEGSISEEGLAQVRDRMVGEILRTRNDPAEAANAHFLAVAYLQHPYGRPPGGDQRSVSSLSREDVLDFYSRYWRPGNAVLILAGDVRPAEVFEAAGREFGSWEPGELPASVERELLPMEENRVRVVNRSRLSYAELRIGFTAPPIEPEEELAHQALNTILGGGSFISRLPTELRGRWGAEQTATTRFQSGREGSLFLLSIQTPTDAVRAVTEASLAAIGELRQDGPTPEELETAKQFLMGAHLFGFQTPGSLADRWFRVEAYGRGAEFLTQYAEMVEALTPEDISRAAAQFLRTQPLVYVVVTDQLALGSQLAAYGMVQQVPFEAGTGAIPQVEVPLPAATVAASAENTEQARDLIARAARVHGGSEALSQVVSWKVTGAIELNAGGQRISGNFVEVARLPDRRRLDMVVDGARVVRSVMGERGWISGDGQVTDMNPVEVQAVQLSSFSNLIMLLNALQDSGADVRHAGETDRFGRQIAVIEWVQEDGGVANVFFVASGDTLLGVEQVQPAPVPSGRLTMLRLFEDPRNVGGIVYPHQTTLYMNRVQAMREDVTELEFGGQFTDEVFRRPIQ
jgi:predicted Zn-dependent peptidase